MVLRYLRLGWHWMLSVSGVRNIPNMGELHSASPVITLTVEPYCNTLIPFWLASQNTFTIYIVYIVCISVIEPAQFTLKYWLIIHDAVRKQRRECDRVMTISNSWSSSPRIRCHLVTASDHPPPHTQIRLLILTIWTNVRRTLIRTSSRK